MFIIIFGVALTSTGVYGTIKAQTNVGGVNTSIKPVLQVNKLDEVTLTVVVNHNQPISYLKYNWNDEEAETIDGAGGKNIQKTIDILPGNNVLSILVEDVSGNQATYEQEYSNAMQGDVEKPKIVMQISGNYVKIDITDETEIAYMTYQWNNEEAFRINPSSQDLKTINTKVEVRKGENTLKVMATDKAGNSWTDEKTYKGVIKPTIDVVQSGNSLIITVEDVEGISYVDIDLNEQRYRLKPEQTENKIVYTLPMEEGRNILKVVAHSISGENLMFEGQANTL